MPPKRPRRPGRPARLSREQVLRAALVQADRGGLDAVTMRGVGQMVRAEPMSLYRHVRNKADLVDGILDLVFEEIALPTGSDWRLALRRRAASTRAALLRHPWAIPLMESRSRPGPANLRHHDAVLGALRAAGFTVLTATRAYNLLNRSIYGFALQEQSLPVATPETLAAMAEDMLRSLPADALPHLAEAARVLTSSRFAYGEEFEVGLDLILDALERIRDGGASERG